MLLLLKKKINLEMNIYQNQIFHWQHNTTIYYNVFNNEIPGEIFILANVRNGHAELDNWQYNEADWTLISLSP